MSELGGLSTILTEVKDIADTVSSVFEAAGKGVDVARKAGKLFADALDYVERKGWKKIPPKRMYYMLRLQQFGNLQKVLDEIARNREIEVATFGLMQQDLLKALGALPERLALTDKKFTHEEIESFMELTSAAMDSAFQRCMLQYQSVEKMLFYSFQAMAELAEGYDENGPKPDDDWGTRFFGYVADISNEEVLRVWGKILAGEMVRPGSFSLRALRILYDMSADDAKAFEKMVQNSVEGKFVSNRVMHNILRLTAHQLDNYQFLGLILPNARQELPGKIVTNKHFQVSFQTDYGKHYQEGYLLSPPAQELATIIDVDSAMSLTGMREFLKDLEDKNFRVPPILPKGA